MNDDILNAARLALQELRRKRPTKRCKMTANVIVRELYEDIEAAIDEGQSLDDIVDCLRDSGAQISVPTLRTYLCRLRTSRNRRKRKSRKSKFHVNAEKRLDVSAAVPEHAYVETVSEKPLKAGSNEISEPFRDTAVAEAATRIKARFEERKKTAVLSNLKSISEKEDPMAEDIARMEEAREKRPRGSFEVHPDTPNL